MRQPQTPQLLVVVVPLLLYRGDESQVYDANRPSGAFDF